MILAENVSKFYGAHAAVSGLNFSIAEGEVVGLLGLNGAGKTTTLRILSGLLVPTSGKISIGGLDMAENPEHVRARLGFLPETPPLYAEMTVADYLRFVARLKGLKTGVAQAVEAAMQATELSGVGDVVIGTLSHGFHKRIGIAQAIVHRPSLILLDEPTSGLDPIQLVHMRQLIRGLRGHNTIIVSSHVLSEIEQMCDRIFVLRDGHIEAEGTARELALRVAAATAVKLEVRGSPHDLEQLLRQAAFVAHYNIESASGGLVVAVVELQGDAREALAQSVVAAGMGLRRLERVQLELENIFLKLATGSAAPSAA